MSTTEPTPYLSVHDASNYVREMLAEAPLFLKASTTVGGGEFAIAARRAKSLDGRRAVIETIGTSHPNVLAKDLEAAVRAIHRAFAPD